MGPGQPFGFDLSELMRMLQSQGPVNWDVARQSAAKLATTDPDTGQDRPEPPIDTSTVVAYDAVVRAAQVAVVGATGFGETQALRVSCVDRRTWAEGTLEGLKPVLEALAGPLQKPLAALDDDLDGTVGADPLAGLVTVMMPMMLGFWSGSMMGLLAAHALGQYDLPLPLTGEPRLVFVTSNIDEFSNAWSLPLDDLRYSVALREAVHAAQRSVPWVREHLVDLASRYVGAYEINEDAFEGMLGDFDISNLTGMTEVPAALTDPTTLLGGMRTDRQAPMLEALQRFVAVLEGYTDTVVAQLGAPMVPSFGMIDEALRRHRVERGEAASFVDRLLGLELDRTHYERGVAFCNGVVERAGLDGLNRLWLDPSKVPTPAEIEAPGLWLERIDISGE
jgi:putative hydrolase